MPTTAPCWWSTKPAGTSPTIWCCRTASTWSSCPPHSPELQPAERLWPLVDEPIANRAFADLDALETVLVEPLPHPRGRSAAPQSPHPLPLVARRATPTSASVITGIRNSPRNE